MNKHLMKILSKFADKNPDMPFMFIAVTPDGVMDFSNTRCPAHVMNMISYVKEKKYEQL
ncbi:MAG: hypothetical protein ACRC1D_08220 [Culicoidibacterales bacterium]